MEYREGAHNPRAEEIIERYKPMKEKALRSESEKGSFLGIADDFDFYIEARKNPDGIDDDDIDLYNTMMQYEDLSDDELRYIASWIRAE
jgi:hypothetical protein